jgi:hypothetical protein
MNILNIQDGKITLELTHAELPALIDLARIAEFNADSAYCTDMDDELPPYYQEREDLLLVAGLWKSVLELAAMTYDYSGTLNQSRYGQIRYIAGREKLRGKRAFEMAKDLYPDEHTARSEVENGIK